MAFHRYRWKNNYSFIFTEITLNEYLFDILECTKFISTIKSITIVYINL